MCSCMKTGWLDARSDNIWWGSNVGQTKFAELALTHTFTQSLRITFLPHHSPFIEEDKEEGQVFELTGITCFEPVAAMRAADDTNNEASNLYSRTPLCLWLWSNRVCYYASTIRKCIFFSLKSERKKCVTHTHFYTKSFICNDCVHTHCGETHTYLRKNLVKHTYIHTFILQVLTPGAFGFPSPALVHCCWDAGEPPPNIYIKENQEVDEEHIYSGESQSCSYIF